MVIGLRIFLQSQSNHHVRNQLHDFQGVRQVYSTELNWQLSENNGKKLVYVRFFDDVSNCTTFYSADIILQEQDVSSVEIIEPEGTTYTTDKFITIRGRADFGSIVHINVNRSD